MSKFVMVALYDVYSYGIRTLSAILDKKGHDVTQVFFKTSTYVDGIYSKEELKDLIETIEDLKPNYIGIAVRSPLLPLYLEMYEGLRNISTKPKIIVGGHHATISPEDFLDYSDVVCVGEGEVPITVLAETEDIYAMPSIFYKKDNIVGGNPMSNLIEDLDTIPLPLYKDDDIYLYSDPNFDTGKAPVGLDIMSTRGCFFSCTYCYSTTLRNICRDLGRFVRRMSPERTIEEVQMYRALFPNINDIAFADSVFAYDIIWMKKFCSMFSKLNMDFRCFGHVKLIEEDMIGTMHDAGLDTISIGIQHGSYRIRILLHKFDRDDEIIAATSILSKFPIDNRYDLITGIPFETEEDLVVQEEFINKLAKPFTLRKFMLRYFPKTQLTLYALKNNIINIQDVEGYRPILFGDWWVEFKNYR